MDELLTIDPKDLPVKDLHQHIVGSIAPRPIAFASTMDENGIPNIAPYSFFNAFSSNPPILVFSSNRKVADNKTKDTLHNVLATKEVVINVVNYAIARQVAISSVEYAPDVNEFEKTGLTPIPSETVKPYRVKESPVQMECSVKEVIPLGEKGGAGHLIICQVNRMHISTSILDENNRIDPQKADLVGRLGRAWYARIKGDCIFSHHQPVNIIPVGYDNLPEAIRTSPVFTGHDLGVFASKAEFPDKEKIKEIKTNDSKVKDILGQPNPSMELQRYAKHLIDINREDDAFCVAMISLDCH